MKSKESEEFSTELQKAFFYKSFGDPKLFIKESRFPEIAFIGRSNAGKSSLINAILNRKSLAKTSRTPGKTKLINVFVVPNRFSLVDLPGFGYSKASHAEHKSMMVLLEKYLNETVKLKCLFVLLDARRKISDEEVLLLQTAQNKNITSILIRTKEDKLNQKERAESKKDSSQLPQKTIYASSLTNKGIDEIREELRIHIQ
ncbi:MAG: ribosome biogenesis GTP-binding protein YihA/YsxC [Leptospiraceae bacterium]|jgi:GTP-binding protein|nr:ribosome biogenesis GTP-binding protein YihA/YsxC [Leptospiraceae bacterium]MCZ8348253.1 ribosome biogenesis GTP-binding protein YihA/YsxC [Leptospiraceae bacterium]PJE01702.1 MAG: ribosome biogenesis GTP-binding protein YsxC [Leptospira sp.]